MSKLVKTDDEWKLLLDQESYRITRESGTEKPFTGKYWDFNEKGSYKCICCGQNLFESDSKFDAGCGWPSFFVPKEDSLIDEIEDYSFGMKRTEVRCSKCDAHLGHVFPDGPPPTGLRYCMNSVSMKFITQDGEVVSDG